MSFPSSPEYLTRPEAARFIRRSVAWLRKAEAQGRGPQRVRLGKSPIYPVESLRQFMTQFLES